MLVFSNVLFNNNTKLTQRHLLLLYTSIIKHDMIFQILDVLAIKQAQEAKAKRNIKKQGMNS